MNEWNSQKQKICYKANNIEYVLSIYLSIHPHAHSERYNYINIISINLHLLLGRIFSNAMLITVKMFENLIGVYIYIYIERERRRLTRCALSCGCIYVYI